MTGVLDTCKTPAIFIYGSYAPAFLHIVPRSAVTLRRVDYVTKKLILTKLFSLVNLCLNKQKL